jgi:hypothetical protein
MQVLDAQDSRLPGWSPYSTTDDADAEVGLASIDPKAKAIDAFYAAYANHDWTRSGSWSRRLLILAKSRPTR